MILTVFGASGGIGRHAVDYALSEGHQVRAYLRNAKKLNIESDNLTVIEGELSDVEAVKDAVCGADAVIWCVGVSLKRHSDRKVLEGHKVLLSAMEECGVKRLVDWATPSIRFDGDRNSALTILPGIGASLAFPDAKEELLSIAELITSSGLDWTIVRFLMPTNKPSHGGVRTTFGDKRIKWAIPRADIARFMVNEAVQNRFVRSMPIIGS